jgi:hypothetical protein
MTEAHLWDLTGAATTTLIQRVGQHDKTHLPQSDGR